MRGFTVIELLIVIAILLVLASAATPFYGNFQVSGQLNENTSQIIQTLRTAREQNLARMNNTQHGVYFEINAGADDRYILYQGTSYALRDTAYDRATTLDNPLSFSVNLVGDGDANDINFSLGLGSSNKIGTIILTHEVSGTRQISINTKGMVEEL